MTVIGPTRMPVGTRVITDVKAQLPQRMLVLVLVVPTIPGQNNKKTPLLVQPGQGDGDPHLGITHQARQRHIWCIAAEIDDQVCLNTYFACLIPTLPKKAG